jgi:hypothetical protein
MAQDISSKIRSSCLSRAEICIDLLAQYLLDQAQHPEAPCKSVTLSYTDSSGNLVSHTWPSIPAFVRAHLHSGEPQDLGIPKMLQIEVK